MKIALIGNTLFSQGAEYALASLARGFAERGHVVDVLLSKLQDDLVKSHPDWQSFALHSRVRVTVNGYRRARYSILSLRRLMRCNNYDVVMCHCSPYSIPLIFAAWGLRRRPLLIHVQHSGSTGVNDEGELLQPNRNIRSILHSWLMNRFDGLFGVSEGTTEALHRMLRTPYERLYTVYNPVLDSLFERKIRERPTHPWLIDPDVPVVVAAGSIEENKGFKMLVGAFAEVRKRFPARLVVFGLGAQREDCLAEANALGILSDVSFPGYTNNLPAELRNASCFVISSIVESFSIVCVEALAAGVPVVSTNCPYGPPEILKGGKYGIIVKNRDKHALAEGILAVLAGRGVKPTLQMVAKYKVTAIIERYLTAIEKIRANRK